MDLYSRRELGKTGVMISPIGISSSFGAAQEVYEEALDRGCNYFTWGTFVRGRSAPFRGFMRRVVSSGKRESVCLGLLSYSHSSFFGDIFLHTALKNLGTEYIDGLILGYYPKRPPQRVLDWALEAKEKHLVKMIGLSTHNREMVIPLAIEGLIDFFHIRYNALHRGAEEDIFLEIGGLGAGLVSFTATSWGKLMKSSSKRLRPLSAQDCYRFVLARNEIHCCMMGVRNRRMLRENLDSIAENGVMSSGEIDEKI